MTPLQPFISRLRIKENKAAVLALIYSFPVPYKRIMDPVAVAKITSGFEICFIFN